MHWIANRVLRAFVTFVLVINLSFVAIRQLPGGPMAYLQGQLAQSGTTDPEEIQALAQAYLNVNPDKPLHEQYVDYMSSLLQGDLGQSIWYNESVTGLLAEALPWTVFLLSVATFLTYLIGIILGAVMAYYEGTRFDSGSTIFSIVMNSVPYYVLGILLVFVLGYNMNVFPINGKMTPETTPGVNYAFIAGVFEHAFLPIASLVLTGFGGLALAMRGNSIQVLGSDFLRVGQLRGLSPGRLATRYVARNAILPIYTSFMIRLGAVFGGSVVLERIFVYRGVGFYLFKAIQVRDYPLMMGAFLLITCTVLLGVLLAELTYGRIDPRSQEGGEMA